MFPWALPPSAFVLGAISHAIGGNPQSRPPGALSSRGSTSREASRMTLGKRVFPLVGMFHLEVTTFTCRCCSRSPQKWPQHEYYEETLCSRMDTSYHLMSQKNQTNRDIFLGKIKGAGKVDQHLILPLSDNHASEFLRNHISYSS